MPVPPVHSDRSPLAQAAVARAVALVEEDGPLDDGQAMRQAFAARGDDAGRVAERAWLLGERLGLSREWGRWRRLGGWVLLALAVAVAAAAWLLARGVLGQAREINALAAFVALLGLHALTLALWLASLLVPWPVDGSALGRLALALTARLPLDRGPHAVQLARATGDVLRRARLAPWAFGGISHLVWSLSFAVLLAGLALGFSVRAYRLSWETTILPAEFFLHFVRATGWLPQALGVPLPDAATLLRPEAAGAADQRAWAWWLMGCVAVYGLAVRLLCLLWCWAMWRRGQRRLGPDPADPAVRRLLARFAAMEPAEVVDEEHAVPPASPPAAHGPVDAGARLVLGFELPPEAPWPPAALPAGVQLQRIDGTAAERAAVLQALARQVPRRLLVCCHAPSSPDRGTERFVREAAALCGACALWPLQPRAEADLQRWRDWLARSDLPAVPLQPDAGAALAWFDAVEQPA
ncbi:DUF2868 domain-containing protein [Pseudorhodoferax sp.]|uniref:DUF2868 domain-containing protein n=1 Tax=Pseudorhodoferax sp. TaxID=1993553 RepID=UPI0039E72854